MQFQHVLVARRCGGGTWGFCFGFRRTFGVEEVEGYCESRGVCSPGADVSQCVGVVYEPGDGEWVGVALWSWGWGEGCLGESTGLLVESVCGDGGIERNHYQDEMTPQPLCHKSYKYCLHTLGAYFHPPKIF